MHQDESNTVPQEDATPRNIDDVAPPENYRQMIDKNVNLTKVFIDIFDMYTGVAVQSVKGSKKHNERGADERTQ